MKLLLSLCAVFWLSIAVGGVVYLARYENTPGDRSDSYPTLFPAESRLERESGRSTLIFFAHPKCPCTRASLRELARLMNDADGKLQAFVVLNKPPGADAGWTETDLRASAEAIPNVEVVIDEGESETRRFSAQTSGLVLLYDRQGKLRFNGGITASRGAEGDNVGRNAIYQIVARDADQTAETNVFGCPLHSRNCQGELMHHAQ